MMETHFNRVSYVVWLALIRLLVLCTLVCYGVCGTALKLFSPGWEAVAVVVFALFSCAGYAGLTHRTIYVRGGTLFSSAARRTGWQTWFFVLYVPYMLYTIWFGLWMAARGGVPLALAFPIAAVLFFAAAYRSLSTTP